MNMNQDAKRQLPDLRDSYELTAEQITDYQRDGHILLRQAAASNEIAAYRPLIDGFVQEHAKQYAPIDKRDTYGKAFIQVGNLWRRSEELRRFVLARRFAKLAADLMGVDGVRIYQDQALFKEPGGGHTPWHQDQTYWPLETPHTITMWMPLTDIPDSVGSMTFVPGSHLKGYMSRMAISDESHKTLGEYIEKKAMRKISYGAMKAGDATFHAGWTLHCAPGNPTNAMREIMTVIYIADGSVVAEPDSNARRNELKIYPNLKAGDVFDHELTPLVFKR
ncbi:phytanoyl-CoA dioxygenase family protein [Paenibacillus silvisoli]|uniref:phytanoyl-CoA dioxygenase family protein n=1 Tax=Paenibacillus silvisoli TaxID=3110539 RepID=UPI002804F720|nr:phytanoyl-CoA dioxygenase family protein [Paenibacillus silvisoli]